MSQPQPRGKTERASGSFSFLRDKKGRVICAAGS
jgi:hypothetical protein